MWRRTALLVLALCVRCAVVSASVDDAAAFSGSATGESTTILLLHGFTDTRWKSGLVPFGLNSLVRVQKEIEKALPEANVLNLNEGWRDFPLSDFESSIFGRAEEEIEGICERLHGDKRVLSSTSVHAIGLSQGGILLRGLIQTCGGIAWGTLVTLGSPHGGVAAIPECQPPGDDAKDRMLCKAVSRLLTPALLYNSEVQRTILPAQYFRDGRFATDAEFAAKQTWLARLNNLAASESEAASAQAAILALRRVILYAFEDDRVVVPRESSWFGFIQGGNRTVSLWEQPGDALGLKELSATGRLMLVTIPGGHLDFNASWLGREVVPLLV